jgi:hypothetical protein
MKTLRKETDNRALTNGGESAIVAKSLKEIRHGKETTYLSTLITEHESTNTGNGSKDHCNCRYATLRCDIFCSPRVSACRCIGRSAVGWCTLLIDFICLLAVEAHLETG